VTANVSMPPPSAIERVLARDRRLIAVALVVLVVLAWSYLVVWSRQMGAQMTAIASMPGMAGMLGMSEMASTADSVWRSFVTAAVMWWTMMIGMMVPSAAPMILLFGHLQRRQLAAESPRLRVGLFTAGYLASWGAFSLAAAAAQELLIRLGVLASMELTVTTRAGAVLVALVGVYELTPLKTVCLRHCRSPAEFLSSHWRRGNAGALRMGVVHGSYCVACCWLLMALLFAVGVMNFVWVAAIAVLVLLEKLAPRGELIARISGVLLLLLAAYLAVSA
jgi:predicted metal-binding membrane protein